MGYQGLIITDDMMMYGVRQEGKSIPETCETALRAGNDMIMISRPPEVQAEVRNHLLDVVAADPEFKAIVQDRAERIVRTKLVYLKPQGKVALYPDPERVERELPDKDGKSFFFDLACRGTTMIRDGAVPIETSRSEKVLLAGFYSEFFAEGIAKYPNAGTFNTGSDAIGASRLRVLLDLAEDYDTVILCLANEGNLDTLESLKHIAEKVAVLSVLTPVYVAQTPWVQTVVAVYGTGMESFKAGFAALAGDFTPEGHLPFSLPGG
jgi:beta-N-acetylhexosaminidase